MRLSYNALYRLIPLVCVSMLLVPPVSVILSAAFLVDNVFAARAVPLFWIPVLTIAAVFFGFFLQTMYAGLLGKRVSLDGLDRDGATLYHFRFANAVLPIVAAVLCAVGAGVAFDRYLFHLCQIDVMPVYYESSLYPFLAAILCFVAVLCGIVLWFYPMERLMSVYFLLGSFAVLLVFYLFTAFFGIPAIREISSVYFAPCMIVYFITATILYNQRYLSQNCRGSVVAVIRPEDRAYNIGLVLCLFFLLLGSLGVFYVLMRGLYLIIRSLILISLFRIFYNGGDDGQTYYRNYGYVTGEEAQKMVFHGQRGDNGILYVFVFLVLCIIIFTILVRSGKLREFWQAIVAWVADFFATIRLGTHFFRIAFDPEAAEEEDVNFKDEKKKLQNAAIRDYAEMAARTDSYRQFLTRLSRLPDVDEQIAYAYTVLVRMYREGSIPLKSADTPREIECKVKNGTADGQSIERITAAFESVRYAEAAVDTAEAQTVLSDMCAIIKRYLF